MTETCDCSSFPVDIRKGRRMFAKAAAQLRDAVAEHSAYLTEREAIQVAIEERKRELERRTSAWPYYTSSSYFNYSDLFSLTMEASRYAYLEQFSRAVTSLRLSKQDVNALCDAETVDFKAKWDARVNALRAKPIVMPEALPELPPLPEPGSLVEVKPPKPTSIWNSIFGY